MFIQRTPSVQFDDPFVESKTREPLFFSMEPGLGMILLGLCLERAYWKDVFVWGLSLGTGSAFGCHPNKWIKALSLCSAVYALRSFGTSELGQFVFRMATVMRVLRIIEVVKDRQEFFEKKGTAYTMKFAFLYHDLRKARRFVDEEERAREVKRAVVDVGRAGLGMGAMVVLLKLVEDGLKSSSIGVKVVVKTVLGMLRFAYGVFLAEAGYRLHLSVFGVKAPVCFDEPWKSTTVAEFWGKRWNLAIAGQLRNVFFKPLAEAGQRGMGEVAVFWGSAALHMIPIVTLGGSTRAVVTTSLFFIMQPVLIAIEKQCKFSSVMWVQFALWSTAPLFALPLLEVL